MPTHQNLIGGRRKKSKTKNRRGKILKSRFRKTVKKRTYKKRQTPKCYVYKYVKTSCKNV